MDDLSLFLFNVLIFTNKYAPFSLAGLVQGRVELNVGLLVPAQYTLRVAAKKVLMLIAVPLRPYPPPSRLMAVGTFTFGSAKKIFFLKAGPLILPPPLSFDTL